MWPVGLYLMIKYEHFHQVAYLVILIYLLIIGLFVIDWYSVTGAGRGLW